MSRADVARSPSSTTISISSGTGASPVSDGVRVSKAEIIGFITSTAMSANSVTFQVSPTSSSGGSWYDLYLGSSQISLTISTAAARAVLLDVDRQTWACWDWLRVVSASTGGEAAGRTWTVFQA